MPGPLAGEGEMRDSMSDSPYYSPKMSIGTSRLEEEVTGGNPVSIQEQPR